MVFVTIKHTQHPTSFEKERQSSLLSTTSRTADASYPSIGNSHSTREVEKSKRCQSLKKQLQKSQKNQQSSTSVTQHDAQDRQREVDTNDLNGAIYLDETDLTLNDKQITELSKFISKKITLYPSLPPTNKCSMLQLPLNDLITGRVIGMGGFGMVRKVKSPLLKQKTTRPCVLKTCKPSSLHNIVSSVSHLMRERYFLSHLKHPHIIRMVAVPVHADPLQAILQSKRIDACFLILEYLPETLHDRIHVWKQIRQGLLKSGKTSSWNVLRLHQNSHNDPAQSLLSKSNKDLFEQQLIVALQVASALEYLHSQRVIYRDLKPSNVGFDIHERVKLFDFGLAIQLANDANLDTIHALPGRVGTTRYMASEVLRKEPYNVKADVFSFSLVLWEMVALERPHENMPGAAVYGDRPCIPKSWPGLFRRILERGWSENLSERPHIREMTQVLLDLLQQVQSLDTV